MIKAGTCTEAVRDGFPLKENITGAEFSSIDNEHGVRRLDRIP